MNKENKREVRNNATIKHFINIMIIIIVILGICIGIYAIIRRIITQPKDMSYELILVGMVFMSGILVGILDIIKTRFEEKIHEEQRELRIAEIKKRAEEGSLLKYSVFYKENTAAKVIEHDIENVVFQNVENGFITFDIHFKTKFQTATVKTPIREIILNHLDKEMANSILKDTITNITIDSTEEGKTQVTFLGKDFCVEQTDVTDDDLIEMFGEEM